MIKLINIYQYMLFNRADTDVIDGDGRRIVLPGQILVWSTHDDDRQTSHVVNLRSSVSNLVTVLIVNEVS